MEVQRGLTRLLPGDLGYRAAGLRAAALGLAAVAGLPPLAVVPLLLAALAGLVLVVARSRDWRVAFVAGLMFGFGFYVAGLYWITEAILVMADEFWWAVPIAVPLLAAVLGLFIAVPCALARLARPGWRRVAVLAGAWTLCDIARQFALSGFPWNPVGSTWEMAGAFGTAFMQPAAWVGIHGLTLFTLLAAGSLTMGRRGLVVASAGLLLWGAAGTARLAATTPLPQLPPGLMGVIVQGNVSETEHRDHGRDQAWADQVFDRHLALTRRGMAEVAGHPAIVVWPETASPYALPQDEGARRAVADAAAPALMTLAGTERFEADGAAHNSLAAIDPAGRTIAVYDKAHLVPFGEYFPPYAHFLLGEQGFVPGPGIRTLRLPGLPAIGPLICYEAIFSGQVVQPGERPSLLVNITNDAWFGQSAGPRQHLAAARMRSVEEGLPMLRAANTGISAVIDSYGRINTRLEIDTAGVAASIVPPSLAPTVFSRFGLRLPAALSGLLLVIAQVFRGR